LKSLDALQRLAGAVQRYADVHQGLCPAAALTAKDGKPWLSWRVAVLPLLEQESLYKRFRLDEPWDSPHNKLLVAGMPKVFAPVHAGGQEPYTTFYQVFTGKGAPFEGGKGPRMPANFPKGTSNIFLIVEGGAPVPWTQPVDLAYDPKGPLPKLGGLFPDGFSAVFADGGAFFISKDTDEAALRAGIMPAQGKIFPWFQRRAGL
jgi:hypothetical protein